MKSKEVDDYIEKQKSPQKEICRKLRQIILAKFPKAEERMRLGVPWYGKFYIVSLKDSVNLGFSIEGLAKKDMDSFSGKGKLMRHLKFKEIKEINEVKIAKLLKLVDEKAECKSCYE